MAADGKRYKQSSKTETGKPNAAFHGWKKLRVFVRGLEDFRQIFPRLGKV